MDWLVLLLAIVTHESHGNLNVKDGPANDVGIFQITPVCIEDYNRIFKTNYSHKDARKPKIAFKICNNYLSHWGNIYEVKTGNKPTYEIYARIWNGGPNGYKKESTKKYWKNVEPLIEHWRLVGKKDQLRAYVSLTRFN